MFELRGVEQLLDLSKALKQAGATDLSRELNRAISDAAKPLRAELRKSARETLPKSGGLAESVAGARISTTRSTSRRNPGVRIRTRRNQLAAMNEGHVRHPVFGRDVWVEQSVTPGWWDRPTDAASPDIQADVEAAMDRVTRKLVGG